MRRLPTNDFDVVVARHVAQELRRSVSEDSGKRSQKLGSLSRCDVLTELLFSSSLRLIAMASKLLAMASIEFLILEKLTSQYWSCMTHDS